MIRYGHRTPKYRAEPQIVDGLRFDSKLEARRYEELCYARQAGTCLWFIRRPSFDLGGGVRYVADFLVVWKREGSDLDYVEVEDCKGAETAVFKVKRRLMSERYPNVRLRLIRRGRERWGDNPDRQFDETIRGSDGTKCRSDGTKPPSGETPA